MTAPPADGYAPRLPADTPIRQPLDYRVALVLFYAGMAWAMAYAIAQVTVWGPIRTENLLAGVAPRPFQYRVLAPWTIQALHDATGIGVAAAELFWHVAASLAAFLAMRAWLRPFVPAPVADLAPVWVTATVAGNLVLRVPWDLPGIFFTALLLDLIRRRNWRMFLPILAVATLNRENTYLAVLAVVASEGLFHRSWRRALALALAGAGVWLAVKLAVGSLYAGRPGGLVEWRVLANLDVLRGRTAFVDFKDAPLLAPVAYAVPWCWLAFLGALNFVWVLVPCRWRGKDPYLKALALLIPVHLALVFLFGNLQERRVYLDLLPLVLPLALQTFFPPYRAAPAGTPPARPS